MPTRPLLDRLMKWAFMPLAAVAVGGATLAGCFQTPQVPAALHVPAGSGEAAPDASQPDETLTGRENARHALNSAARAVGWIAGLCVLAALGTLVLSFVVPIVPRGASLGCLAGAVGGYVLQYALFVYGVLFSEIAIWLAIALLIGMGVLVGWPWISAWHRRVLLKTADKLPADDPRAKAALTIAANPRRFKSKAAKTNLLTAIKMQAGIAPDPVVAGVP